MRKLFIPTEDGYGNPSGLSVFLNISTSECEMLKHLKNINKQIHKHYSNYNNATMYPSITYSLVNPAIIIGENLDDDHYNCPVFYFGFLGSITCTIEDVYDSDNIIYIENIDVDALHTNYKFL